jgi:hypothetical protein
MQLRPIFAYVEFFFTSELKSSQTILGLICPIPERDLKAILNEQVLVRGWIGSSRISAQSGWGVVFSSGGKVGAGNAVGTPQACPCPLSGEVVLKLHYYFLSSSIGFRWVGIKN